MFMVLSSRQSHCGSLPGSFDEKNRMAPSGCQPSDAPLTSTWPHLRCDVGLEEGEYLSVLQYCVLL